jgi:hypothetical protein
MKDEGIYVTPPSFSSLNLTICTKDKKNKSKLTLLRVKGFSSLTKGPNRGLGSTARRRVRKVKTPRSTGWTSSAFIVGRFSGFCRGRLEEGDRRRKGQYGIQWWISRAVVCEGVCLDLADEDD